MVISNLPKRKAIKLIALTLSMLLVWQSVVWSDPDIFQRQHLAPQVFFDPHNRDENSLHATVNYLIRYLVKFEKDPENHNLFSIKNRVEEALAEIKNIGDLPGDALDEISNIQGSSEEGYISLDLGTCSIRYYNPRIPGSADPGFPCRVVEDVKIGEYLSRQVLIREPAGEGYIARGNPRELFAEFMKTASPKDLRASIRDILPQMIGRFRKLVSDSSLNALTKRSLEVAIGRSSVCDFMEIGTVVLPEENDPAMPRAWLLGFNTSLVSSRARMRDVSDEVEGLLGEAFPDTIGLCADVLALVENDRALLEEYIFHELVCLYFGHEKARKIQETLFPDNYEGISGDMEKGHADGELSLALKHVIWSKCGEFDEKKLEDGRSEKKFNEFSRVDFRERGPQRASEFYSDYKKWYEWLKRRLMLCQSRLFDNGKKRVKKELAELEERHNYVLAKVSWVWAMEGIWSRIETIAGWRRGYALTASEKEKIKGLLGQLEEAHKKWMRDNPLAVFLKGDVYAASAVFRAIEMFAEGAVAPPIQIAVTAEAPAPARSVSVKLPETPEKKAAELRKKMSLRDIVSVFKSMNWQRLLLTIAASLVLSAVLSLVLPVNWFTVWLSLFLPLALFAYMIVKYWSWTNLLVAIGMSVLLSFLLPAPWMGLSMSIVILAQIAFRKAPRGTALQGPAEPVPAAKTEEKKLGAAAGEKKEEVAQGAPTEEEMREADRQKKESIEKTKKTLENVYISLDLLLYMFQVIKLQNKVRFKGKPMPASVEAKKATTKTILDNVFDFDTDWAVPDNTEVKKILRPIVFAQLEKPEMEWGYDTGPAMKAMREKGTKSDEDLARALRKLHEEVIPSLGSNARGDEQIAEGVAVQELICEYFKINKLRTLHIRQCVALLVIREDVSSGKTFGFVSPGEYYTLGRVEFYHAQDDKDYARAEEAFETAVKMDPENKEFLLTLGLVKHYLRKYKEAGEAYRRSLAIREQEKGPDEINKAKKDLLEKLIEKTDKEAPLEGKRTLGINDAGITAVIFFLKRVFAPNMSYMDYALKVAPKLEEAVFTFIPFAALSLLMTWGGITLSGVIAGMGTSYLSFAALHSGNMRRVSPGMTGLKERLRYVFKAPFKLGLLNLSMSSLMGGLLFLVLREGMPWYGAWALIVFMSAMSYAIGYQMHEAINVRAFKDNDHGPATIGGYGAGGPLLDDRAAASEIARFREKAARGEQANILFACLMNAERSFLMDVVSKYILAKEGIANVKVDSCGMVQAPSHNIFLGDICKIEGVPADIVDGFRTGVISEDKLRNADLVVVADAYVAEQILTEFPAFRDKIVIFRQVSPEKAAYLRSYLPPADSWNEDYLPDYSHIAPTKSDGTDGITAMEYIRVIHAALKKDLFGIKDAVPRRGSTGGGMEVKPSEKKTGTLLKKAEATVPQLVNALISASKKDGKTVLALDLGLGEGEINSLLRGLLKILPTLEENNADLKRFFKDLEVVKGDAGSLARRINNLTDPERGSVRPENVIVVTKSSDIGLFAAVEGKATIAGIDDASFPGTAYLPLLEIMLFAVGKHLGWDEAALRKYYEMIPNVVPSHEMPPEEMAGLFSPDQKTLVIRLIPDAEIFEKEELRELMDGIRTMLARA